MMMRHLPDIDIAELIPHGESFRMVDTLLHCDERNVVVETLVRSETPLCVNGKLQSTALLEIMAQACAVRIGFLNSEVKAGVIAAVRHMEVLSPVVVGDFLRTEISVEAEVFGMLSCKGTIECNGNKVASAELKLMV